MSNVVKLSDRKKAQEQAAKKAAAEQRARGNGPSNRAKIPLLILSIAIVLLGIFWEPVMQFLAGFFSR